MRIFVFLFLFPVLLLAQEATPGASFPLDYQGIWVGELEIFNQNGKVQAVPMELRILPIDDSTYTYTMIYGIDTISGKRAYLLRKGKEGAHHWVIDEQDGILLDNFYYGGVLHGPFSVSGTLLFSSLEKRDGALHYAIIAGPDAPFQTSGTTTTDEAGNTTEYVVNSFQPRSFQRAVLRPKE